MPSKINSLGGGQPAALGAGRVASGSGSATNGTSSDAGVSPESVHITDTASQLAALDQMTRGLPVVNASRVAAIRGALAQGTYSVSAQRVADGLMAMEQALSALG